MPHSRKPSAEDLAPYRPKRPAERFARLGERAARVRLRRTERDRTVVEHRNQPPESGREETE